MLPGLVEYSDPEGVFKLSVPQGWFTKRKGDKNREGIVFITGDFKQAVTMSIEVLHVKELFRLSGRQMAAAPGERQARDEFYGACSVAWAGIQPTGLDGVLDDWGALNTTVSGMAGLLASHKEELLGPGATADRANVYKLIPDSVSSQGKELKVRPRHENP